VERRHRHKNILYDSLARLFAEHPDAARAIDAVVAEVNASVDLLDSLLERQNFRLAHWRAAARDLGYRRFFDINGLVGLRVEHEHVFRDTHRLVLAWLTDGTLDGLRIDHPDGLRDPEAYLDRLPALFLAMCERRRRYRDYTRHELHEALRDTLASFAVYRTYVRPEPAAVDEDDARRIVEATETARAHRPDLDGELFEFLRDLLRRRLLGDLETELTMRFQQLSGPVMAKGVEDTAFYSFNRLVSLNEVGGDPSRFGVGVEEFHQACDEAQELWPRTMLATSTHDTKRSEDVRARLALLSEMPERWGEVVRRWAALNARHHRGEWPDRNAEYLFYQT